MEQVGRGRTTEATQRCRSFNLRDPASNLRVARSSRAGRAKRDGHFWVVRVSSRPPTVPELCPDGPGPTMRTF